MPDYKNERNAFEDFGFDDITSVNLDELEEIQQVKEEAVAKTGEAAELQARMEKLYNAFLPLLANLKKDADKKDYIYFPERGPKIESFEAHLAKIYYGK